MENPRGLSSSSEDLSRKLDLIMKRLEALETVILDDPKYQDLAPVLGLYKQSLGLYADPLKIVAGSKQITGKTKPFTDISVTLSASTSEAEAGEDVIIKIQLANRGKTPVVLLGVEKLLPNGFELIAEPENCSFESGYLDLDEKKLEPSMTEEVRFTMRSLSKGTFDLKPTVIYRDTFGHQVLAEAAKTTVSVSETIFPDRICTGFRDLDKLLFGGIPENHAVALTSTSSDERDLLVCKFLQTGVREGQVAFYVTAEAGCARNMPEDSCDSLHLFICNPKADKIVSAFSKRLPNISKVRGLDNLNDVSIALSKQFRALKSAPEKRRACIEIISDVLLQHRAVQTRRWLSDLIPELKSRGFTTLATVNPRMHSSQEVHAILGLFDGEIEIREEETTRGERKVLKIKRMHDHRYLESEIQLRKERFRT